MAGGIQWRNNVPKLVRSLSPMQIIRKDHEIFDAVIVGSGATGGWVAKTLAEAGMQVALLEAGHRTTEAEFTEHLRTYDLKYRGRSPEIARNRPIQSMKYACRESNFEWFVDDIRNPYTYPPDKPFQWTRGRQLGGRSLTWARQSYRLSPLDFSAASHDGYGENWPVTYEEMVPYYETVERYVGISGEPLGLMQFPDSVMQPPMAMTCGEKHFKHKVNARFDRNVTIGRTAILTKPLNGRQPCHYCGPCEHGCVTHSYFSSVWTTVADAEKSGNCKVLTDAVVSHVTTDKDTGLANGVAYFDRLTRAPRKIRAKVVVLSASTLESTRILLNSGDGFCNSSGALGHYVMDHMYGGVSGVLPVKESKRWAGPPQRPNGLYLPRYLNVERPHTNGMIRGFGAQMRNSSSYGSPAAIAAIPGFGAGFKRVRARFRLLLALQPGHLVRVPGALRELRQARSARQGRLGRPGSAHERDVERQRDAPVQLLRRRRRGNVAGCRRRRHSQDHDAALARRCHARGRHGAHGQRSAQVGA